MDTLHSVIIGKGEPLLILHGFFGMGDNWRTLAKQFSENYQVHSIDQRNHGRSFHSDVFTYEVMVQDVVNYLEFHNLKSINLLGHSMGGKVAMLFAVTHPEKVKKIIIADIAPKYYPTHHQLILEALNAINFDTIKSRNEIEEILKKYIPEIGIRMFLSKNVYRKTKTTFAYRFNLKSLTDNIEEIGKALPPTTKFNGDTLFLKGENSKYITQEDSVLIKKHFPTSEIVRISKAGHWLHAENPTDFYKATIGFLEKKD